MRTPGYVVARGVVHFFVTDKSDYSFCNSGMFTLYYILNICVYRLQVDLSVKRGRDFVSCIGILYHTIMRIYF